MRNAPALEFAHGAKNFWYRFTERGGFLKGEADRELNGMHRFSLPSFGDIGLGADHAVGAALVVTEHIPVIDDIGKGAVGSTKSIFGCPQFLVGLKHLSEVGENRGLVLRMNLLGPGNVASPKLLRGGTIYRLVRLVEPRYAGGDLPVPDAVAGGEAGQMKPLLALP